MDRAFGAAHEARAHLHGFGAEREGGRHALAVADAAGRDHGDIRLRADRLEEDERADLFRILEATAFGTFHDEAVDARLDAFHRRIDGGDGVIDGDARIVERRNELRRAARRGGDEFHTRIADETQHGVVLQEADRQVDAEGRIRQFAHLQDLGLAVFGLARRGLDDAEAARLADGGGELRAGNPAHRRLDDRIFRARVGEYAVHGRPSSQKEFRWPEVGLRRARFASARQRKRRGNMAPAPHFELIENQGADRKSGDDEPQRKWP
jgi:hypothetical protein